MPMPAATEASEHHRRVQKPSNSTQATEQQQQEQLACPRCDSTNTKFCYYNNYNFSQPRHFCKSCRRYWTHGGTLRDIPVGGGTRKNAKRSRLALISASPPPPPPPLSNSFTSLLSGPTSTTSAFLGLGGFGLGLGIGIDDFNAASFGRGLVWPFPAANTMDHHYHHHHHGAFVAASATNVASPSAAAGDFCSWPGPPSHAVSTPAASGFH